MAEGSNSTRPDLRVAIVGLGPIGRSVAQAIDRGIMGLTLVALSAEHPDRHRGFVSELSRTPALLPIEALADVADLVIECAPSRLVRSIVAPFVGTGKTAVVLSAGALLEHDDLIDLARRHGGQIVVPTGALIGLDAVTAAAVGTIHSVRMITRKPVQGLIGAPYLDRTRHRARDDHRAAQDLRWNRAAGRQGLSGQSERGGGAVARRHRTRSNHARNLGRSGGDAQYPSHRGGVGFGAVFDVDRKHPV